MSKRILIAGEGSYIGESFRRYLQKWPEAYAVTCLDMVGDGWKRHDLSGYDAVYMVAGIAHVKETDANRELYFQVNRDLAAQVAGAAKQAGVGQFVYLSSMSVYGVDEGIITKDTPLRPQSAYASSKAQAEALLAAMGCDTFRVAILRPPMVYGKGCRGNFNSLEKMALKLPVFPRLRNRRSMLYIDNLSECVRLIITQGLEGYFFPQNREYVCTYDLAKRIARANGKRLYPGILSGLGIKCLGRFLRITRKAFGTLVYENMETLSYRYCVADLEESIRAMYPQQQDNG